MIHQYKLNGFNIVLDRNSGAIHLVDELAYDIIALYETTPADEITKQMLSKYQGKLNRRDIQETLEDIAALKEAGKLFSEDSFEHINRKNEPFVIKALCLHVAHTCNLTCSYCFAREGRYHGDQALMSFEVGKQALDFLIANSGSRTNLEVDFFGGEPLMNWQVVKELIHYARQQEKIHKKKFRFTLTTNGMLLDDEVMEFANREIDNVVLSLDGRKEIHDRLRRTGSGEGSYDTIVPKFQKFVKTRGDKSYYIRGTFTRNNIDFVEDILHMADLGFRELSMEPVVCAPDDPHSLTEAELPEIYNQYERLAKELLKREEAGNPFHFYHYTLDLSHGPCIHKRVTGCGSGSEYLAVTPWGDLYPCHQFVGETDYAMGDVWKGITKPALRNELAECNVYSLDACKDCWAQFYCSGGCAANAYHATGSVHSVYELGCQLFRKRMECAIMIQAAMASQGK